MKHNKKDKEKEILRQMLDTAPEENDGFRNAPENNEPEPKKRESLKEKAKRMYDDQPDAGSYHPLTLDQTKKIKLILYPIVLVIAIVVYLIVKGYIH